MFMVGIEKLKKFVQDHTRDRDSSHGYEHMEKVYDNAMTICTKLGDDIPLNILRWVTIVSWLHDVADHKYDKNGESRKYVQYFLQEHIPEYAKEIMTCIDCISFSREKKEGCKYYEKLLSPEFVQVRNIVSDADKLEALGVAGLERCEAYTRNVAYENKAFVTDEQVFLSVLLHCKEKLFILSSEYMRTVPGHEMAIALDAEMKEWLERK